MFKKKFKKKGMASSTVVPTGTASTSAAGHAEEGESEFEELVAVLQLDGVLDFDAVRRAAAAGTVRVRECDTNTPLVQIGSHLYAGKWTQTLGTDMLFCATNEPAPPTMTTMAAGGHQQQIEQGNSNNNPFEASPFQRLELVSVSDTRLCAQKVLLATDEEVQQQQQQTKQ